jgi:hypothetical protein
MLAPTLDQHMLMSYMRGQQRTCVGGTTDQQGDAGARVERRADPV